MPFVDPKALGGVAGIIGAGGNRGAMLAGILKRQVASQQTCLLGLGMCIMTMALCSLVIRFSEEHKSNKQRPYAEALIQQRHTAMTAVTA